MKYRWHSGQTGNQWLDQAWFTVAINGETLEQRSITVEYTYALKEQFAGEPDYYDNYRLEKGKPIIARLREIRNGLQDDSELYILAFPRIIDIFAVLRWHGHPEYMLYSKPQNSREANIAHLYKAFPLKPEDQVDVLIFAGSGEFAVPLLGPDTGRAGSIQNIAGYERRPGVKRQDIRYLGFQYGVSLVQVANNTPNYRLSENELLQLWEEAKRKVKMSGDPLDRGLIEQPLESVLTKFFRRRFGVEPGE